MWSEFVRVTDTPVGRIALISDGEALCGLRFHAQDTRRDGLPLLVRAEQELQEYFAGRRRAFSVPLCIRGTAFQEAVWRALTEIPCGETISYGALARRLGRPGAARAVGMALNANPLPVFIPCHRVVGADGSLTGYAGGLEIKQKLLGTEGIHVEI